NYGQVTPPVEIGAQAIVVSNTINGLTPYTTYHYQAVASNSAGVFYGGDVAFTTVPRFAQMGTNGDWGSFVLSRDGRTVVAERNNVMYVSTNLGATFTSTAGSRILSSAGKITYVSEDYGQTWRTNPSAPLSLGNLVVTANADTIFS